MHPTFHILTEMSSKYHAFITQFSSNETPKTVQEASNSKPWKDAMNEELQALEKNKTSEVVELPKGKKTVGYRWIYTIKYKVDFFFFFYQIKYKVDGTIERYKAKLVAKRYTQIYGIDYQKTFAMVEKIKHHQSFIIFGC